METFRLVLSKCANREIADIGAWLLTIDQNAALRFSETLTAAFASLCESAAQRLSEGQLPAPLDGPGSIAFSRPVYRMTFTTQKKRRRGSASGTYYVYYELQASETATIAHLPNTVKVIAIAHAASAPITAFLDEPRESDPDSA